LRNGATAAAERAVEGSIGEGCAVVGGELHFARPTDHSDIDAYVGEKPHIGPPLRRPHLLLSKPRGISQRLLDVLPFEIGVSF